MLRQGPRQSDPRPAAPGRGPPSSLCPRTRLRGRTPRPSPAPLSNERTGPPSRARDSPRVWGARQTRPAPDATTGRDGTAPRALGEGSSADEPGLCVPPAGPAPGDPVSMSGVAETHVAPRTSGRVPGHAPACSGAAECTKSESSYGDDNPREVCASPAVRSEGASPHASANARAYFKRPHVFPGA